MTVVVDTNVPIAANGRNTHASESCQYRCVEFLQELASKDGEKVAVDFDGEILAEYSGYLNYHGQPGVGDMFYKYLHDNLYRDSVVLRVSVTHSADERRGYEELPENAVDRSDRVFLAVAIVADADIANAVDSDWHEQSDFLQHLEVEVRQLCPEHQRRRA